MKTAAETRKGRPMARESPSSARWGSRYPLESVKVSLKLLE